MHGLSNAKLRALQKKKGPPFKEYPDGNHLYIARCRTCMPWIFRSYWQEQSFKLTLGRYPTLSLLAARRLAADINEMVALGVDPRPIYAKRKKKGLRASTADTFGHWAREFIIIYARPRNRSWRATANVIGLKVDRLTGELVTKPEGLADRWGDRAVGSITRREVADHIFQIAAEAPVMAKLVKSTLSTLFAFLQDRGVVEVNPARGIATPGEAVSRDRVFDDVEIVVFWHASEELADPYRRAYRFQLLTGCRRGEASGLTRAELSADGTVWTIPGSRSKNKHALVLPLSALARRQLVGDGEYPFSVSGVGPINDFTRTKRQLERRMRQELPDMEPFRLHDLRRSCATGLSRLGVQPVVVEAILNHRSGQIRGVARTYNRHDFFIEKQAALELWADHVEGLLEPKVVPLVRRA